MQPCQKDSKSFFRKLQKAEGLDLRDKRGKKHDLAPVLVGVLLAVLSNRDGNLSSLHRHLVHHYEKLTAILEVPLKHPVSRAQLPRILEKVAVEVFDKLIFSQFGMVLNEKERHWFGIDGKELRGSIISGDKRGEALVQAVAHESGQTVAQDFYCGKKESEKTVVREMLRKSRLVSQKLSLDALHCNPKTLEPIAEGEGKYVVGLKNNQKELLSQVMEQIKSQAVLSQLTESEKGHGRIETRSYGIFDILEINRANRWEKSQIRTAIRVRRERENLRTGKKSVETSYYISNEVDRYEELIKAIRGHWQIEANNYLRDVTWREDKLRSKKRRSIKFWRKSEA